MEKSRSDSTDVILMLSCVNWEVKLSAYSPSDQTWYSLKDPPCGKITWYGTCSDGKYLYLAGGYQSGRIRPKSVWRYNPDQDSWKQLSDLLEPRHHYGLVTLNGFIYAMGGRNKSGEALFSVEQYNPETNKWNYMTPMDRAAIGPAVVTHGGHIYVIGGNRLGTIQRFSPDENTWIEMKPSMELPRFCAAAVSLGDLVYLIGGRCCTTNEFLDNVDVYNCVTGVWGSKAHLIEKRSQLGVSLLNNRIYIFGGITDDRELSSIECYDPEENKWTTCGEMTDPCAWPPCAPLRVKKYLLNSKLN